MMFISNAFATTVDSMAQNAPGGGDWIQLLLQIALVFLVLYLLLIRPQQKRFKEHEKALNSIKKGTKVIVGGIIGSVTTIEEDKVKIEISKNVEITVVKAYISQVLDEKK
ncbi:MAG: preprotein translocase subunit YajC [Alphaproteobacteria bacterium]|nr:preprotein translocase subunit YajC [Alphaproteobacteria bacterium]